MLQPSHVYESDMWRKFYLHMGIFIPLIVYPLDF